MTLIVNLVAGPGAGKSTYAADIFSSLKKKDINCELVREYAKELTWLNEMKTLSNQYYVTATQYHRQFMVDGKVDVMITDSPLILGLLYFQETDHDSKYYFRNLVVSLFKKQNNLTYFVKRKKKYNPKGRNQTYEQALVKDADSLKLLDEYELPYKIVEGNDTGVKTVVKDIIKRI